MKSAAIRDGFLQFFARNNHTIVPSSSLIPGNDPTLLFTNAGMVQFKDVFLGTEKREYSRAASSQRCVRAGGKHNDLENVGYTARHHTFFEMLGNFSFGDYFKEDAIKLAWEFLTVEMGLPSERLWVTVHISDDEAADIWLKKVGVSADRFSRLDEDNFWQMGDTGPCGPCSEIFYDHGENVPGGPPGSDNDDLDRYIEIWNLVFMQYERFADGTMKSLPKPSVDTGMGLERMAAVMQGVHSNYEIDLFQNLIKAAAEHTDTKDLGNQSLRVIADHIRSCAFLVGDGVVPSNEGRGYVLRRIIRRAIRHGNKLGQKRPFFHKLVNTLVAEMGDAYPELRKHQTHIERTLLAEEERFALTLEKGMGVLEDSLEKLTGKIIPGEVVFALHDTYGFPTDLTNDIARERNLSLDMDGFTKLMDAQKKQSSQASQFAVDYTRIPKISGKTEFKGYERLNQQGSILALVVDGAEVDSVNADTDAILILDQTPFYGESGGQVGDSGFITSANGRFVVNDCQKHGDHHLHIGRVLEGSFNRNESVNTVVDDDVRQATALNHSATHLLHAALRKVLGEHVTQKGSLVDCEKLRFDFSHPRALSEDELKHIEALVNEQIRANTAVATEICSMSEAKSKGAMALFGEKYGNVVRVLTMGDGFSVELCGGTHVNRTGDIGLLRIVSESGIAAGVRRIEALTGKNAFQYFDNLEQTVKQLNQLLKTSSERLLEKTQQLLQNNKQLEKEFGRLQSKLATSSSDDLLKEAVVINDIKVLATSIPNLDVKALRDTADQLKNKLGKSVVMLGSVENGKVNLIAGVSKDVSSQIKAGDLMREIAAQVGGKGGGRPDMAQGGGTNPDALPQALANVEQWVRHQLAKK
jgi:alanyl-tRNA synthetase